MEEQDDTILWLVADAERWRGPHRRVARNYAVVGQGAPALVVGNWKQTRPPKMDRDVVDSRWRAQRPAEGHDTGGAESRFLI